MFVFIVLFCLVLFTLFFSEGSGGQSRESFLPLLLSAYSTNENSHFYSISLLALQNTKISNRVFVHLIYRNSWPKTSITGNKSAYDASKASQTVDCERPEKTPINTGILIPHPRSTSSSRSKTQPRLPNATQKTGNHSGTIFIYNILHFSDDRELQQKPEKKKMSDHPHDN